MLLSFIHLIRQRCLTLPYAKDNDQIINKSIDVCLVSSPENPQIDELSFAKITKIAKLFGKKLIRSPQGSLEILEVQFQDAINNWQNKNAKKHARMFPVSHICNVQ